MVLGVIVLPLIIGIVLVLLRVRRTLENDRNVGTLLAVGYVRIDDGSVAIAIERVGHSVGPLVSYDVRLTSIDVQSGKQLSRIVSEVPMVFVGYAGTNAYFQRPDGAYQGFDARTLLRRSSTAQIIAGIPNGQKLVTALAFDERLHGFRAVTEDHRTWFIDGRSLVAEVRELAPPTPCPPQRRAMVMPGVELLLEGGDGESGASLIATTKDPGVAEVRRKTLIERKFVDGTLLLDRGSCQVVGASSPPLGVMVLARARPGAPDAVLTRVSTEGQILWSVDGLAGPGPAAVAGLRANDAVIVRGSLGTADARLSRIDLTDGRVAWTYP